MLEALTALEPDPILGLTAAVGADSNPNKVDLGAGVYRDEHGHTPVMAAVKAAEALLLEREQTKAYTPQSGVAGFNEGMVELLLGSQHPAVAAGRVHAITAPGGSGALRIAAGMLARLPNPPRIWLSDPSWPNHDPLLGGAGLTLVRYPYYDGTAKRLDFDGMVAALGNANAGDAVLLHSCCHNPSGADLNAEQWDQVAALCARKSLLPFVDSAYLGLGKGLEEDAYGIRALAAACPEMLVAASCSKNFGLYRERVGVLLTLGRSSEGADVAQSHLANVARTLYSLPPSHGASTVGVIFSDPDLRARWESELTVMRERINAMRAQLVAALKAEAPAHDFGFIAEQFGMFSFLGLTPAQVHRLRDEYSVYMTTSSRANLAGVNQDNVAYLAKAIAAVI